MPNPSRAVTTAHTVVDQVFDSNLSKKGQTTTTGVFEGQPVNQVNRDRGFTVPTSDPERVSPPLDIFFRDDRRVTYLDTLRAAKRI